MLYILNIYLKFIILIKIFVNLNIRLIFDGRVVENSFKRSYAREKYTDKRIVMFCIGIFKNAAHFEIFFFRSIRVNHPPMSILISVAYVYCTSGADARQDFSSLTPIINHRSVISRDFSFPFGRNKLFSDEEKGKRFDRYFDPNIEATRNLCQIEKANLMERYGGKFMYAVEMNAKIPARQSNVLELFADGCSNLKFSGSLNSLGASLASS